MDSFLDGLTNALLALVLILLAVLVTLLALLLLRVDGAAKFVQCSTDPNVTATEAQAGWEHCRRHLDQGYLP